ncbi:MAG: PBP1A family penicillin-binding protein [Ignavibacteriales bacterium]|nr:MAG: PBP1A family penicillin-binding protein [Ignavibacteriales bacterium]
MNSHHNKMTLKNYKKIIFALVLFLNQILIAQELPPINLDYSSYVLSSDGKVLGYYGEKKRVDARSTGYVSKYVLWSLIATEDRDFYNHDGVSIKGLVRGLWQTITGNTQGGSTLTMQLARNLFLTNERTISRKLSEIDIAYQLESKYTKDELLLLYLNTVFFGHNAYGIWAAAETYYSKTPDQLSITESAALVGLLQSPNGYDPLKRPDKMLKRRNEVLYNLVEVEKISEREFNKLKKEPLNLIMNENIAGHFVEYVRIEASKILSQLGLSLNKDELKITTTLNYEFQKAAEDAVIWQWNQFPEKMKSAQIGLVSVEPNTGEIKTMIGGNPDSDSKGFNRATQILRQPGSAFKPFLYGEMLEDGFTIETPLIDSPLVVDSGKSYEWRPTNSDNSFSGIKLPMITAVQHSVNLSAAHAITELTSPDSVIEFANRMGIKSFLKSFPSLALGTSEVNPLDMASSFAVFAAYGNYVEPFAIKKIEDKNGRIVYETKNEIQTVTDSATAYLLTTMMETVVDSGTATSVRKYYKGTAAGKTGTTQNSTDAWFVGYNPHLSTAVWIGYDDPQKKLSGGFQYGGSACAPVWARMMNDISKSVPGFFGDVFPMPSSVDYRMLCIDSGERAVEDCVNVGYFPVNISLPVFECHIHSKEKEYFDIHYAW